MGQVNSISTVMTRLWCGPGIIESFFLHDHSYRQGLLIWAHRFRMEYVRVKLLFVVGGFLPGIW